jgi:hypothetical protein
MQTNPLPVQKAEKEKQFKTKISPGHKNDKNS